MIINRQRVIERLKAGEKLKESGNTFMFKNGDSCSASTEIWLLENNLVKVSGWLSNRKLSWLISND